VVTKWLQIIKENIKDYPAQQRIKEIGNQKIFGTGIAGKSVKEVLKPVAMVACITKPIQLYRGWEFFIAGIAALLVAAYPKLSSLKAVADPSKGLRTE
jgi:hypothetical protein